MSRGHFAFLLGSLIALTSRTSRADDVPSDAAPKYEPASARFGARGQIALLGGTTLSLSYQSYESNASYLSATFTPVLD